MSCIYSVLDRLNPNKIEGENRKMQNKRNEVVGGRISLRSLSSVASFLFFSSSSSFNFDSSFLASRSDLSSSSSFLMSSSSAPIFSFSDLFSGMPIHINKQGKEWTYLL